MPQTNEPDYISKSIAALQASAAAFRIQLDTCLVDVATLIAEGKDEKAIADARFKVLETFQAVRQAELEHVKQMALIRESNMPHKKLMYAKWVEILAIIFGVKLVEIVFNHFWK